ncbi:MAG: glycosyltransferase family 2 protein [Flavobacteriales bacterium]|nr:glycosyltransferase family 2 protein [Flavobacteriales bacterium]
MKRVSISIHCRNEARYIEACLQSIVAMDRTGMDLAVVVCDGMSEDGTREIVQRMAEQHALIRLVDNPHRTTPQALNLGLQAVPFDYGMILGAHAEVAPDYARACLEALEADDSLGCAGGLIENLYETEEARAIGAAMAHPFGVGGAHFRTGAVAGRVDTVAFGVYRREVFERVGWFDEDLVRNQDDEFNFRVTKAGYGILLLPQAKARYHVRASFLRLYRQYFQYGYWKVYVNIKHGTVTTLRQVVPAAWIVVLVLGGLAGLAWPVARWPYLGMVGLYVLASCMAAVKAAPGPGQWPSVVRAYWTLHAAYGLGYFKGAWRFMLLRGKPEEHSKALTR